MDNDWDLVDADESGIIDELNSGDDDDYGRQS